MRLPRLVVTKFSIAMMVLSAGLVGGQEYQPAAVCAVSHASYDRRIGTAGL